MLLMSLCLLIAALAPPVHAESANAATIERLRRLQFLDAAHRQELEDWIRKQAETLADENVDLADKRKIRRLFDDVVNEEPAPTEDFKQKFADKMVLVFDPYLKKGEPTGALMMVYILYDLRELRPTSLLRTGGLLSALSHPLPAVKYWAARTIRLLQPEFAELAGLRGPVIEALRKAGMDEPSGVALGEIYRALDFSKSVAKIRFGDEVSKALVDIIEVRGEEYAIGETPVSDGDVAGLEAMAQQSGPMTDAAQADLRKRYLTALARMLCRVTDDYAAELEMEADLTRDRRARIRQLMQLCRQIESEFSRLLRAAGVKKGDMPNVFAAMRSGDMKGILAARVAWCGSPPDTKGVLNDEAFGVPLGAGYAELKERAEKERAAAETRPAEESSDNP